MKNAVRVSPEEFGTVPLGGAVVGVDFETEWSAEYSVESLGVWAFCHDPRFKVWAVSVSDGVFCCVCRPEEFPWASIRGFEWVSHHREFDRSVYERLIELALVPGGSWPWAWRCSSALCGFLQYPRDLSGAALAVLGVEHSKAPRSSFRGVDMSPDLFGEREDLRGYCARDAELCLALWLELSSRWPSHERVLFELTCAMGRHGWFIDWDYVHESIGKLAGMVTALGAALPWSPPLSVTRFREACSLLGVTPPSSTAANDFELPVWIKANQRSEAATWVRHMQRIRSTNRTEKLLESFEARRLPTGRMCFDLRYCGADPGRWSGAGGVNVHGLNRKAVEGVDLRRCIVPPAGCRLGVVDYSQMESRVLLFLAGETAALDMLRENPDRDVYEVHARATMGYTDSEPLADYCARTGSGLRQLAKARVLGLGFGCGARRFIEVARIMAGLCISMSDSVRIVRAFRDSNPLIVALWDRLAVACAASAGGDYVLPFPCTSANPVCGRYLFYRDVRVVGKEMTCVVSGERVPVFGGLLAENWTQGAARDIFASAWLRCVEAGFPPVLSTHDEFGFEFLEESAEADLSAVCEIMERPVPWAPGLSLRVSGSLMDCYGK